MKWTRASSTWLYGVPQHRQRLVLVGTRDGTTYEWPEIVDAVTVRDAISDLPILDPEGDEVGADLLPYSGPESEFQRRARKGCSSDGPL